MIGFSSPVEVLSGNGIMLTKLGYSTMDAGHPELEIELVIA